MRLGMARGADPVWSGFSDVHADWHYEDITDSSATMDVSSQPLATRCRCVRSDLLQLINMLQVPMVRGSAILTHLYSNANPVITPLCLSSINGNSVSYQCPSENPSKHLPAAIL